MRLIIIAALIYLLYRTVKSWLGVRMRPPAEMSSRSNSAIDDVMVQDPFCGVYFPRRDAVPLKHEGNELLFCSNACRDSFLDQQREIKAGVSQPIDDDQTKEG